MNNKNNKYLILALCFFMFLGLHGCSKHKTIIEVEEFLAQGDVENAYSEYYYDVDDFSKSDVNSLKEPYQNAIKENIVLDAIAKLENFTYEVDEEYFNEINTYYKFGESLGFDTDNKEFKLVSDLYDFKEQSSFGSHSPYECLKILQLHNDNFFTNISDYSTKINLSISALNFSQANQYIEMLRVENVNTSVHGEANNIVDRIYNSYINMYNATLNQDNNSFEISKSSIISRLNELKNAQADATTFYKSFIKIMFDYKDIPYDEIDFELD